MAYRKTLQLLTYECIIGQRGSVKTIHMWLSIAVVGCNQTITAMQLLLAMICFSQFCVHINDLADKKADGIAGKKRPIAILPPIAGKLITWCIFGTGALILSISNTGRQALPAYLAAALLGGPLYSCGRKPLKVCGIFGPLSYTVSVTLAYVLTPWTALNGSATALLFLLTPMLLEKWTHLHFHQIIDFRADRKSGLKTWVTQQGKERARKKLQWLSLLACLTFLSCISYVATSLTGGIAAVAAALAATIAVTLQLKKEQSTALTSELPAIYLGLSFALYRIIPPILFAFAAWKQPDLWPLLLLSGATGLLEAMHSVRYKYK